MAKLKPDDLEKISEKMRRARLLREDVARARVTVHMGTCGIAAGSRAVMNTFIEEIANHKIKDISLTTSSCAGLCSREPMATVEIKDEPPIKYVDLTPEKVKVILEKHIIGGEIVKEYALSIGSERVL